MKATYKKLYTLTIDLNGGVSTQNLTHYMLEGTTLNLETPTKNGYNFTGYSGVSGMTFTMGSSDVTIRATWSAKTYTITYNCNGGSGATTSSTHIYGTAKNLSNNGCYKIIEGTGNGTNSSSMVYNFIGWSTSSSATMATYTDSQSVTNLNNGDNITLYAVWDKLFTYNNTYTVLNDGGGNWRIKFLSSGTLTMNYSYIIDAFLVGGGGGGGGPITDVRWGGGGGGYTTTKKSVAVSNKSYTITIGAGGGRGSWTNGGDGEPTSAFNITAKGGSGGYCSDSQSGGNGGSGGGGYKSTGGSNGGDGGGIDGGKGQGTTTREFGESNGTLYSGGGGGGSGGSGNVYSGGSGGGSNTGIDAADNTGGGGGAARYGNDYGNKGGDGGSGIVVIRNHR